jgi:uncharacterized metal-binding protein
MTSPRGGSSQTFPGRMHRVYYLGFIIIVVQGLSLHHLKKTLKIALTTLTTVVAKYNHNNPSDKNAYV